MGPFIALTIVDGSKLLIPIAHIDGVVEAEEKKVTVVYHSLGGSKSVVIQEPFSYVREEIENAMTMIYAPKRWMEHGN